MEGRPPMQTESAPLNVTVWAPLPSTGVTSCQPVKAASVLL